MRIVNIFIRLKVQPSGFYNDITANILCGARKLYSILIRLFIFNNSYTYAISYNNAINNTGA